MVLATVLVLVSEVAGSTTAWDVQQARAHALEAKENRRVARVEGSVFGATEPMRANNQSFSYIARSFRSLFKNVDERPLDAKLWVEAQAAAEKGGLNFLSAILSSVRAGGDMLLGDKRGGYQSMLTDVQLVETQQADDTAERMKTIMQMPSAERSAFLQLGAEEQIEQLRQKRGSGGGSAHGVWTQLEAWQSNTSAHLAIYRNSTRSPIATVAPEWTFPLDFDWSKADEEQLHLRPAWDQLTPPVGDGQVNALRIG
jgi:hypothetical protein